MTRAIAALGVVAAITVGTATAVRGNRPRWAFEDRPGTSRNDVARSAMLASKIVLPVNPTVTVPTPLPPCPALRGEPCRPATPTETP